MDRDQERRERAYKIWEDEGRPDGQHDDHWQRAEDQHEATEREVADVTEANERANDSFNGNKKKKTVTNGLPPSTTAPD